MRMRKILIAMVGVVALAALPASGVAGVINSVHDIPDFMNYTGTAAKMGACSFCHIPHKAAAGGDKLFPETYAVGLPDTWSSDKLSNMCWYCHGAASGYTSAREVNPFQATSHLRNTALLTGGIQASGEADIATVPTDLNLTGTQLRCVSCHSIHDNAKRPFLAWGTSGDFSADATNGFCGKCHPNRNNVGTLGSANPGMHPSRTAYADAGTDSPLVGVTTIPGTFQVDMSALADPLVGAWNLGGHALYTGGTEQGSFVCGSCHAVHANETADFTAADGGTSVTTAVTNPGNDLLVMKHTANTAGDVLEDICEGCHSIVPGSGTRGPGLAGTFSHPTGTDSVWGAAMYGAGEGYQWNTAGTNGGGILCQSCHDMHFSGSNHGATATGAYLQAFQCAECHTGTLGAFGAGVHHVSNIAAANTLVKGTAVTSTATDWATRTQTSTAVNYWASSTTLDCKTCHGIGNAGAHNNAGGFPGLAGIMTESDMCVDCHGFNPSVYTTHATTGTASHFVGAITDTAYKVATTLVAGFADNAPRYSPDGANGSVECYSCHTVRINGKNGHVVSYQSSNNAGDGITTTKDAIRNLLLVSGNSDTFTAASENLCTACHGATPGGGQSHPVLPNYTTASTMVPSGTATTVAGQAVGQINCESCHRPHDADTDSNSADWTNAWILEAAAFTDYIDYSPVCDLCHAAQY